jgi:hypothetical protein
MCGAEPWKIGNQPIKIEGACMGRPASRILSKRGRQQPLFRGSFYAGSCLLSVDLASPIR